MISRLKGIVADIDKDSIELDVHDVFYRIYCSRQLLSDVLINHEALCYIEYVVREDAHILYGFLTPQERECFKFLTSVQGVGYRVGLALMSLGPVSQILGAIQNQDKVFVTRAEGVGPKLAARIINELREKIPYNLMHAYPVDSLAPEDGSSTATGAIRSSAGAPAALAADSISALVNLGYRASDAERAVTTVLADNNAARTEEIVRLALSRLAA